MLDAYMHVLSPLSFVTCVLDILLAFMNKPEAYVSLRNARIRRANMLSSNLHSVCLELQQLHAFSGGCEIPECGVGLIVSFIKLNRGIRQRCLQWACAAGGMLRFFSSSRTWAGNGSSEIDILSSSYGPVKFFGARMRDVEEILTRPPWALVVGRAGSQVPSSNCSSSSLTSKKPKDSSKLCSWRSSSIQWALPDQLCLDVGYGLGVQNLARGGCVASWMAFC
jgi:hypothetical protein